LSPAQEEEYCGHKQRPMSFKIVPLNAFEDWVLAKFHNVLSKAILRGAKETKETIKKSVVIKKRRSQILEKKVDKVWRKEVPVLFNNVRKQHFPI
jgi:hypothetical protein